MLDVLARARQNASWQTLLSPWSPSGLGLPRQVSLDNLLGFLTLLTGDPVRTVKVLTLGLFLLAGLSAYWVVIRWWNSKLAATAAGVLYMTSQASIGRVASGWLHYEVLIALAPLVIYVWIEVLDRLTVTRIITLSVLLSVIAFARQDLVLWLIPAMAVYVPIRLLGSLDAKPTLRRIGGVVAAVCVATLALSLYLVLPLTAGVHAPWFSTAEVFQQIRFNLLDRSLDAYQSLLGFGRDLGYLPFNGEEWWNAHPWLPLPLYYFVQALLVACAFAAIAVRRDRRTLYLLASAVIAAFLGKGIRSPVGTPYWWAVEHVPIFGSLRGPNRWMIPQAFAYSALAAFTLSTIRLNLRNRGDLGRRMIILVAAPVVVLLLLPVAPTLLSGFRAWRIPDSTVSLMRRIGKDPSQFAVASVPYDQAMTYVRHQGYQGWEHDIGIESSLYSDRSTVSTNSWSRGGSDFVDFTASLLSDRNPAFTQLLGSVGVKYLLRLDYPAQSDLVAGDAQGMRQQKDLAFMPGLTPTAVTPTGALYRVSDASPRLSFRTNIAVILGGSSGLAALAALPGVRLSDWAAYTADDLLTDSGSMARLLALMRVSDVIVVAGASPNDLAVLASRPLAQIPGITSDPGLDRQEGLLLTDESARKGSLADQSVAPPSVVDSSTRSFTLRHRERLELWSRVLTGKQPGVLTFSLDGRAVRSIVPLDPAAGGFRWVLIRTLDLAGGRHSIRVTGSRSPYGGDFEVDETRLIRPSERSSNLRLLRAQLAADARKVSYTLDLSQGPYLGDQPTTLSSAGRPFWLPQDRLGVSVSYDVSSKSPSLRLRLRGRRRYYTVAQHTFRSPTSWSNWSYAELRYRGSGRGDTFDVLVDFNEKRTQFASFPLVDDEPGWHDFVIPLRAGQGYWRHIVSVRVATPAKVGGGFIELGGMKLLFPRHLVKQLELPTVPRSAPRLIGARSSAGTVAVRRTSRGAIVDARVVASASSTERLVFLPQDPLPDRASIPVRASPGSPTSYRYSFDAPRRGVLVLDQTYDPRWRVSDRSGAASFGPVTSLVDGYVMRAGPHAGTLSYPGRSLVRDGVLASLCALGLMLVVVAGVRLRSRPRRLQLAEPVSGAVDLPSSTEVERALILGFAVFGVSGFSFPAALVLLVLGSLTRRAGWSRPAVVAIVLLLASPLWIAANNAASADRAAVLAITAMLIAVTRATLDLRRLSRA